MPLRRQKNSNVCGGGGDVLGLGHAHLGIPLARTALGSAGAGVRLQADGVRFAAYSVIRSPATG